MSEALDNELRLCGEQIRLRLEMGDRTEVPREVDHSATFSRKADAAAAAADLTGMGYEVQTHRRLLRFVLHFTHITPVDYRTASAFLRQVIPVVESRHGRYEGWGALVHD